MVKIMSIQETVARLLSTDFLSILPSTGAHAIKKGILWKSNTLIINVYGIPLKNYFFQQIPKYEFVTLKWQLTKNKQTKKVFGREIQ